MELNVEIELKPAIKSFKGFEYEKAVDEAGQGLHIRDFVGYRLYEEGIENYRVTPDYKGSTLYLVDSNGNAVSSAVYAETYITVGMLLDEAKEHFGRWNRIADAFINVIKANANEVQQG